MSQISPEELMFLERMEQQRIKHNLIQKRYRANKAEQIREYNKKYYETLWIFLLLLNITFR